MSDSKMFAQEFQEEAAEIIRCAFKIVGLTM